MEQRSPESLRFADLDAVRAFLARLDEAAPATSGTWTVGQILYHLAATFEVSCRPRAAGDAAPARRPKLPPRLAALRGRLPRGVPMPPELRDQIAPPPDADAAAQLARLRDAIDAFEASDLPANQWPVHPILGALTKGDWRRFHLRHCELHLGHVVIDDEP